jgi:hypothetical protein
VGRWVAVTALALAGWVASASLELAHANGVSWSVGVQAPGAIIQAGSGAPMVVYPPVVYPAVTYSPQVAYAQPPVVVYTDAWGRPLPAHHHHHHPAPLPPWYGAHAGISPGHPHDRVRDWP